jgi:hypothetical protein
MQDPCSYSQGNKNYFVFKKTIFSDDEIPDADEMHLLMNAGYKVDQSIHFLRFMTNKIFFSFFRQNLKSYIWLKGTVLEVLFRPQ